MSDGPGAVTDTGSELPLTQEVVDRGVRGALGAAEEPVDEGPPPRVFEHPGSRALGSVGGTDPRVKDDDDGRLHTLAGAVGVERFCHGCMHQ